MIESSQRAILLLDKCICMKQLKQIQSHLITTGSILDSFIAGRVIACCAISNWGDLGFTDDLFNHLHCRTAFVWNTMIRAFVEKQDPNRALLLYRNMLRSGHLPNNYTFSFILRACVDLVDRILNVILHSQIIKLGWGSYDFVQNGLIHLYANCDRMVYAQKLLDISSVSDVIAWTAVINGYVKNGDIETARKLFDEMPERNSVSWSAMITGYVQIGEYKEALEFFNAMQTTGFKPNHSGIVGALSACGFLGALDQGKLIHSFVNRNRIKLDMGLSTAFVDMYAKCGCIEVARCLFEVMPVRDVFSFTSLMSGLANHGDSYAALELFWRMQDEGVHPNEITFLCVLNACSRMGLVAEGLDIFRNMSSVYGIQPGRQHYGCIVHLLGRTGMLEEAKKLIMDMPVEPDCYALGALLNACSVHGDVGLGEKTVKRLERGRLDHSGVHVALSNMYASAERWDNVVYLRKGMVEKLVRKVPGCSSIEVDGVICGFVAGDTSHPMMNKIETLLLGINTQMKFRFHEEEYFYI